MTRTALVALTLLHFVWQGALIHGALALLLRLAKRSSANVRYAMGVTALALMAIAPIATATWLARSLPALRRRKVTPQREGTQGLLRTRQRRALVCNRKPARHQRRPSRNQCVMP